MFFLLFLLNDRRIRIQEAQNHVDPVDPDSDPDPQHWSEGKWGVSRGVGWKDCELTHCHVFFFSPIVSEGSILSRVENCIRCCGSVSAINWPSGSGSVLLNYGSLLFIKY
jgi:hypothetical protein